MTIRTASWTVGLGLLTASALAGCSGGETTSNSDTPTAEESQSATGEPAGGEISTTSTEMGSFLVDSKGMTMYLFTKDSPGKSVCEGDCLAAWPAVTGKVTAGDGVEASKIGTIERSDGTTQATYGGWPLYHWAKDTKPGDTTGQGVGGVWYVMSPDAKAVETAGQITTGTSKLGTFLTDSKGMAVYLFTKDSPGKSVCEGDCLAAWPAVTGKVTAGDGVEASKIGTIERSDGTTQATYGGWPLYYWVKDTKPGDTTGQDVGGVWYLMSPDATAVKGPVKEAAKGAATGAVGGY